MKTLQQHRIKHPSGEFELFLEVLDDGLTQHRVVCWECNKTVAMPTTTPDDDSKKMLQWMTRHASECSR